MKYFKMLRLSVTFITLTLCVQNFTCSYTNPPLRVLTVSTPGERSLRRYLNSAVVAGLKVKVLGTDVKSEDISENLKLVNSELDRILRESDQDEIVMFTKSESTLIFGTEAQILETFRIAKAQILLSGTPMEPQISQQHLAEVVAFIGYASSLRKMFRVVFNKSSDDSLVKLKIKYDIKSLIFQHVTTSSPLIGSCARGNIFWDSAHWKQIKMAPPVGNLELNLIENIPRIVNTNTETQPFVLIGDNSPTGTSTVNYFANYMIQPGMPSLRVLPKNEWELTTVFFAIFIPRPYPFLERFFKNIFKIEYPKSKLHVRIYNWSNYSGNIGAINEFTENTSNDYRSFRLVNLESVSEWDVRNSAALEALEVGTEYYFNIDASARLGNPQVLKLLIQQNRTVISPLLTIPYKSTNSNFWGALNRWGRRAKTANYDEVVREEHRGIWNVPCVSEAYIVHSSYLPSLKYTSEQNEVFCTSQYSGEWQFHLTNQIRCGYRVTSQGFKSERLHPELYQVRLNRYDWERSFLHPEWRKHLESKDRPVEPCQDVYWFPLVTPLFCTQIIEIMEAHGNWTMGTNYNGTKEELETLNDDPYPTVDIDVFEIGFHYDWHDIARSYILPLRRKVFGGFVPDPPYIETTFVIRYKPEEQSSNQPHHDHSTVTVNMALNLPGKDYTGGGCRFLRQNCSVTDARLGWILMHPGHLTHYHEGMSTTSGTRYILVSFIDPPVHKKDFLYEEEW